MTLSWRASLDPSMKEPIVRIQMPLQGPTESREAWKQVKPTERHVASGNQYRSRPECKGLRSQVLAEAHSPTMALCQGSQPKASPEQVLVLGSQQLLSGKDRQCSAMADKYLHSQRKNGSGARLPLAWPELSACRYDGF